MYPKERIDKMNLEELETALSNCRFVYPTLVGNLYPPIVLQSISDIQQRIAELKGDTHNETETGQSMGIDP